eukprot:scaffold18171_cov46-Attheya_sp.AAC.1
MNVSIDAVPEVVRSFFVDRSGESREEESFCATWTSSDFTTKDRDNADEFEIIGLRVSSYFGTWTFGGKCNLVYRISQFLHCFDRFRMQ